MKKLEKQYNLAVFLYEKEDYKKALPTLKKLVKARYASAAFLLSNLYSLCLNNRKLARYWFFQYLILLSKNKTIAGQAFYHYTLANSYHYAEYRPPNYRKVIEHYTIAANNGCAQSQFELFLLYKSEWPSTLDFHNLEKSKFYLQKAINNDHAEACYMHGEELIHKGDIDNGFIWIKKSVSLGYYHAANYVNSYLALKNV